MIKPVIVVIAYNRSEPLNRLLGSLNAARFSEDVKLIISVDGAKSGEDETSDVKHIAESFQWQHGEKILRFHDNNIGLKNHVLECSALSEEYGSAIILEDDLYVSPDFYQYAIEALKFSEDDKSISGISLYNHLLNVHAREPFYAIEDGFDNYYFQFASSWGQAYTKRMWADFRTWYEGRDAKNDDTEFAKQSIPTNVSGWKDGSWLKFFIRYMIEEDKYFLYPRVSLTTNFGDEGTHSMGQASELQVPLLFNNKNSYHFSKCDESFARYDAFFENVSCRFWEESDLKNKVNLSDVTIDLYGTKNEAYFGKRYVLSSKALSYKVLSSYGRLLRPHEANIFEGTKGNAFFLYDSSKNETAPAIDGVDKLFYNYRAFKAKYGLEIIKKRLLGRKR